VVLYQNTLGPLGEKTCASLFIVHQIIVLSWLRVAFATAMIPHYVRRVPNFKLSKFGKKSKVEVYDPQNQCSKFSTSTMNNILGIL
jgi:hypothetical protein